MRQFRAGTATTGVDGLTIEGSPIGTPYYMSPEQVRGEKSIDARAKVYALGVLFYECLTGRKPFMFKPKPASKIWLEASPQVSRCSLALRCAPSSHDLSQDNPFR